MQHTPLFITVSKLILASGSPRRRDMLSSLGIEFSQKPAEVDETPFAGEPADSFARRMAHSKASTVAAENPASWVLGADTVVCIDDEILGKPGDAADARLLLGKLSGRSHRVITGVSLSHTQRSVSMTIHDETRVTFNDLSEELISSYVATGEPLDKAGAYGIQGAGSLLVRSIEGSCANVIGLPIDLVATMLLEHRLIVAACVQPAARPE